ncbi:receptor-type tyrosine-protein phosphatase F-like [Actinia tenebrosa]|uniref:Receptor-type tyrosine-protein phosphatase F-like n=1 Tax=Actinia tenebrosa TaxID=6105 RepID=A0A6P8HL92_ACTTE|nr:receptor-type tyrosine-protein phosphatase F-like [Actinia tenebrosa]
MWRIKVPKTVTTKTLTGLKEFANYRVTLTVMLSSGEKTIETMAMTGEDVPDTAPVVTDIYPVRYDTMKVMWSSIPENHRNGIFRGYKIYYKELLYPRNKWEVFVVTGGDVTSTMVTGLKSYTEYCVKMSAFTSKGEYPDWGRKHCKIVKTPSLSIEVQARTMSFTEILLKFVKPEHSVPSKKVQVDYGKLKDELNMKKACYGSSCVIDNLEPDTMYYFRVTGYVYQRGETPTFTKIKTSRDEVLKFRRRIN